MAQPVEVKLKLTTLFKKKKKNTKMCIFWLKPYGTVRWNKLTRMKSYSMKELRNAVSEAPLDKSLLRFSICTVLWEREQRTVQYFCHISLLVNAFSNIFMLNNTFIPPLHAF